MPRKLTAEATADIREAWVGGLEVASIADAFDLSVRHVQRLVSGLERSPLPRLDVPPGESVTAAVRALIDGLGELDDAMQVRASSCLALARRLDNADPRSAAALARGVDELVSELRGANAPPSPLDLIRARRDARVREMFPDLPAGAHPLGGAGGENGAGLL